MSRYKEPLVYLLAFIMVSAGFGHLTNPAFFVVIVPPDLPNPEWLNVLSGLAEITLGVFLLERRVRFLAAWGLIALFIAVFPANLYVAQANLSVPEGVPGAGNGPANWIRIPFQGLFILWAWWYTRPDAPAMENATT
jgi:uncharacterized membrane protein